MTARLQLYPRLVFLDSSANLALIDANDANHTAARSIRQRLVASRSRLLTTNYIVDESYTLVMSELGTQAALAFLRDIRQSAITIERLSAADEERAEQILGQYRDHTFSYTDATSRGEQVWVGDANEHQCGRDRKAVRGVMAVVAVR